VEGGGRRRKWKEEVEGGDGRRRWKEVEGRRRKETEGAKGVEGGEVQSQNSNSFFRIS
jgi:hypothetical protein